jgi:acid phosphatase
MSWAFGFEKRIRKTPWVLLLFAATLSCGGGSSSSGSSPGSSTAVPQFGHVVLLVEENHDYSTVIGSPDMPYLNQLAAKNGLATQYFANTHPSLGNYFMLTTGQLVAADDSFAGMVTADNLVHRLVAAGKTWKCYADSLPAVGYIAGDSYPYVKRHNPFSYFSDVLNNSAEAQNQVPFSEFASDLSNGQLPNFAYVVPNLLNDAHDGSLKQADDWLQKKISPLLSNPTFQKDGLLIIVFDEAGADDSTGGGGRVAAVIISSKAKAGYRSTTHYQHQSTLRLILDALGISHSLGAAGDAPGMGEFFASR